MQPIKISMEQANLIIVDGDCIESYEETARDIIPENLNRADVNVIVSGEDLFLDPNPDNKRFKVFWKNPLGNRTFLETKQE